MCGPPGPWGAQFQFGTSAGTYYATTTAPATAAHYYLSDHLNSTSMVVNASTGAVEEDNDYRPYGGIQAASGSPSGYLFTGKERDSETGNDYFGARYNASNMGRFMTPDPLFKTKSRILDPQEWNMYAYVRNSPTRLTDPTGMDLWMKGCGDETTTCHKDYVGAWDADHKTFTPTTIQSDKNGKFNGHQVFADTGGIHVDSKYQGVFASNTNSTVVQGGGKLDGFKLTLSSNGLGTNTASGIIEPNSGHSLGELRSILGMIPGETTFVTKHEGDQLRGGNEQGPDIHVSFVDDRSFDNVHFDWRYPGTIGGARQHARDQAEYEQRKQTMKQDPDYDLVGPTE